MQTDVFNMSPARKKEDLLAGNDKKKSLLGLAGLARLSLGFAGIVLVPLLLFGLGGRILDQKLHSSPLFFIGGLLISLTMTSFLLLIKIKKELKKIL